MSGELQRKSSETNDEPETLGAEELFDTIYAARVSRVGAGVIMTGDILEKLSTDLDAIRAYDNKLVEESHEEMAEAFTDFYQRNAWLRPKTAGE